MTYHTDTDLVIFEAMKTQTKDGSQHQEERKIDESEVNMMRIGRVIWRMRG